MSFHSALQAPIIYFCLSHVIFCGKVGKFTFQLPSQIFEITRIRQKLFTYNHPVFKFINFFTNNFLQFYQNDIKNNFISYLQI